MAENKQSFFGPPLAALPEFRVAMVWFWENRPVKL
jgi:hypothetical protein